MEYVLTAGGVRVLYRVEYAIKELIVFIVFW